MQSTEQSAEQSRDQRKPWLIPPKTDGHAWLLARKREAIECEARELGKELGEWHSLPTFKRRLLLKAAELLLEKRPSDPVRNANAARQIFSAIGLAVPKDRRPPLRLPSK